MVGRTEFLKARVSPAIKLPVKKVADGGFLSKAAWLKRMVDAALRITGVTVMLWVTAPNSGIVAPKPPSMRLVSKLLTIRFKKDWLKQSALSLQ